MKTTKLVIGIISIVLSVFITFQSMVAGLGNALSENNEISGSAGLFLAILMLIAGIVGIATRKGVKGGYVSGAFYIFAGLIGFTNMGSYGDLAIWSGLCLIFGIIFILGGIISNKKEVHS